MRHDQMRCRASWRQRRCSSDSSSGGRDRTTVVGVGRLGTIRVEDGVVRGHVEEGGRVGVGGREVAVC